jgi:iron complex transport system substrate-binding protein
MKPKIQWYTSTLGAQRLEGEAKEQFLAHHTSRLPLTEDGAEVFILTPLQSAQTSLSQRDDPPRWAIFTRTQQVLDMKTARAPLEREAVAFAARCWLVARGERRVCLHESSGTVIDEGRFEVDQLSSPVDQQSNSRLITLAPSNAEIVEALGCFERVIACETSSDIPEGYRDIERLGPDLNPDLDRVEELAPDLILSSLSVPGMERVVTRLRTLGCAQLVLAPRSVDEVMAEIERVAYFLDVPLRGERVIEDMERQRAALLAQCTSPPRRVYLEWWPKPMFTPSQECFSNELISLAGGVNVFKDRLGASVQIDPQALIEADPEVCFVSWCGVPEHKLDPRRLINRAGLERLPSAQRGWVYAIDEAFTGRPGPRMLEASRRMASVIAQLSSEGS